MVTIVVAEDFNVIPKSPSSKRQRRQWEYVTMTANYYLSILDHISDVVENYPEK